VRKRCIESTPAKSFLEAAGVRPGAVTLSDWPNWERIPRNPWNLFWPIARKELKRERPWIVFRLMAL
jgi:hypothetical protein